MITQLVYLVDILLSCLLTMKQYKVVQYTATTILTFHLMDTLHQYTIITMQHKVELSTLKAALLSSFNKILKLAL